MHFFKLSLAALSATAVSAQISAAATVTNLQGLTSMAKDLDTKVKSVTLLNGFQTGPEVIQGYHGIVKQATKDYQAMSGGMTRRDEEDAAVNVGSPAARAVEARAAAKYTEAEQQKICAAYKTFVTTNQALLATTIGKHGILEATGVAYQIAAVVRGVEGVYDELSFTLIGEVPSCADASTAQKKNLDKSLQQTIDTYAGGLP